MRKIISLWMAVLPLVLSSCEVSSGGYGNPEFPWGIVLFALVSTIVCVAAFKSNENDRRKMKVMGLSYSEFFPLGAYAGGHPSIDKSMEKVYAREENNGIVLYHILVWEASVPERIHDSQIPFEAITDITIEDASTIENKVTMGRIFLLGAYAWGWQKKKKNEMAFLVVDWKRERFEHSTTFCFEGKDAYQRANIARNRLIRMCESSIRPSEA